MSPSTLPPNPNIEQLKNQAKDLLNEHKSADPASVERLRKALSHLADRSDDEILQAKVSLKNVQQVIAREYGFALWADLKRHVESMSPSADTASQAESEFLANMSHEIRTLLNTIIGMAELLSGSALTADQLDHLGAIQISAEQLLQLLNDILDVSKIEAHKLVLDTTPFSLHEALDAVLQTQNHRAREKGLELACQIEEEVPDALLGDPVRLRQIVVNLVSNAIKFTDRGTVDLGVEIEIEGDDEIHLHFSVRDTGIGIPADKLDLIFSSFSQADGSINRQFSGTGLGLAISSSLVEMMDGQIWVESEEGLGSTFHFTAQFGLPDPDLEITSPASEAVPPLHILVVEDNAFNQQVAVGLLKRRGHTFSIAENGIEALEALERKTFDLVFMDVQMPQMDGLEATAAIRQKEGQTGNRVPIVGLTAHAMKGDRERCLAAGMDDYLAKPVQAESFYAMIAKVDF